MVLVCVGCERRVRAMDHRHLAHLIRRRRFARTRPAKRLHGGDFARTRISALST